MSSLKSLIGIHQNRDASHSEIEDALAAARAEAVKSERALGDAVGAYRAALIGDEAGVPRAIAAKEAATLRHDRAAALVEALTARHAVALAAEESARVAGEAAAVRRRYDEAVQNHTAVVRRLTVEYPKHAAALVDLLRAIAEADALSASVNEALPDGADPIPPVEVRARHEMSAPARVIGDETFEAWCRTGGWLLSPNEQGMLSVGPDGRSGTWRGIGCEPVPVALRRFRRITTLPEERFRRPTPLASSLNLPGLHVRHVPFWKHGAAEGSGVIAAIETDRPLWGKPVVACSLGADPAEIEIIPLDEADNRAAA